ncbi:MAG: hypothetical protein WAQ53_04065 [Thiofilum sp.]|uniref:hypothetical protein n=1 Tax=Thiofilum sp. TaxID=2212733 RepID=UPI0025F26E76|nr:hypothetical protein [Thiofilum sp.]MBK8454867.1 hypothetical protein [Thiofilum sp.]
MDLITSITTVLGSIIAVATFWSGVHQYRQKLQLETFRLYADKYNEIITPSIVIKWQSAIQSTESKNTWHELEPVMIKYLNLTWEEMYLVKKGVIDKKLWQIWKTEIDHVLSSPFAKSVITQCNYSFLQSYINHGMKIR